MSSSCRRARSRPAGGSSAKIPTRRSTAAGGASIAHDLVVKDNANRVDISGNSPGGGLNTVAGIGHDLKVARKNHGGTMVDETPPGHDCTQSDNSPYSGAGNVQGNNDSSATPSLTRESFTFDRRAADVSGADRGDVARC